MKHGKRMITWLLIFALACGMNMSIASAASFSDVTDGAWYADEVNWCVEHDIMSGITETDFAPSSAMVRVTVTDALYRAEDRPAASYNSAFSDVASDSPYASAVAWAAENSIMSGYGGGVFGANNPVTREQLATILWRCASSPSVEAGEDFVDEARISDYAQMAVDWARTNGIINGRPGNLFDPKATITRAEVAAILYRYLNSDAGETHTNAFDLERGTVLLNNGIEMPILGIGTFTLSNEQAADSVYWALGDGYHLIDTASAYGNEVGVGQGIQQAIDEGLVKREDIFVTTKLWPSNYNMDGIDASLERLNLDYIDLLLLHQPMGDYIGGYQAMEQAVAEGKVRAIGVSNFTQAQFEEIMEIANIPPTINQVETHPNNQQNAMIEYLDQYGTVLEAWFPLGGRGHTQELFANETISSIAAAHGKSSAQIILRWHLQAGHIAIPGSNNPDHILENISIFDFSLSDEEMAQMAALDTGNPYFGGFGDQGSDDAADRWGLETD